MADTIVPNALVRDHKENGKWVYGSYYTYTLVDTSSIPAGEKIKSLDVRSYKLGDGFGPDYFREQQPEPKAGPIRQRGKKEPEQPPIEAVQPIPGKPNVPEASTPVSSKGPDMPRRSVPAATKKSDTDTEDERRARAALRKQEIERQRRERMAALERDVLALGRRLIWETQEKEGQENVHSIR